ncbi:hypothetical protein NL676_035382 [Syzygium grande]|nr:hypothetical protein NL676_035382 [Syzygium grande]
MPTRSGPRPMAGGRLCPGHALQQARIPVDPSPDEGDGHRDSVHPSREHAHHSRHQSKDRPRIPQETGLVVRLKAGFDGVQHIKQRLLDGSPLTLRGAMEEDETGLGVGGSVPSAAQVAPRQESGGSRQPSEEIILAAVDNPSNAVEWAMAEMINQPELLHKATEEIDRVVGKERLVQEFDIPQLNYIKACAREAFRLHPSAPFNVPHVALSDTVVAGYHIPKGSHVLLSRVGLGRNPKIWDEPLKFKPDRHTMSDQAEVLLTEPDLRFISFSTGRRGCIAATLGTTMTVMLLARLIQGFSWSKPSNLSSINLAESRNDLFLAEPLIAQAEPRLPSHFYLA